VDVCKDKILFSIVIPVYNSGQYLKQCITSVQKQNFKNFEIILIEDKSTDTSNKICKFFSKKYANIKLINHKKRYGVSRSRNDGIKKACGKYIIFIDSDDYLIKNNLNNLARLLTKINNVDVIFLDSHFTKLGNNLIRSKNVFKNTVVSKKKNIENLVKFFKMENSPVDCWRYIYKRNFLIKKKFFFINKINLGEDQEFVTKVLCSAKNLSIYYKPFYCYRMGSDTLRNKVDYEAAVNLFKVINHMCKIMKNNILSKLKTDFIKKKIHKPLCELKPQIICLNEKQIDKISKFIEKNNSNFKILSYFFQKNEIYFFMKNYGIKKSLLVFKSFIEKKIKSLIKNKKYTEIYVFGLNTFSQGVIQVINNHSNLIKGIFDNNEKSNIKHLLGLKIISPEIFFSKNKKKIFKIFVIICNQQKETVKIIYDQLKNYGLKQNQLVHINFYNDKESVKSTF